MAYQIEMLWKCSHCGQRDNRGLAKHCTGCGYPKDEKCEEYFPDDISERSALTGDKAAQAVAGPDWKCRFCGSLQASRNHNCSECGCDKETGQRPWKATVKAVTEDVGTGERREDAPWVEDLGHEHGGEVIFHGKPAPKPVPVPVRQRGEARDYRSPPDGVETDIVPTTPLPWARIAVAVGIAATLGLVLWLVLRTRVVEASVADTTWEYRVHVDRWHVQHRDGWSPDHDAFDVRNEGQRIHHHDKVVAGTHQEAYTETYSCGQTCTSIPRTCTSNKNGTATCTGGGQSCSPKTCTRTAHRTVTDYRDEPRYQTWYSWNVWDWAFNRTVRHAGHTQEPSWPSQEELAATLAAGEKERHRREEAYTVLFVETDGDRHTYEPKSLGDFQRYPKGRQCRLKVGIAHGVEVLP